MRAEEINQCDSAEEDVNYGNQSIRAAEDQSQSARRACPKRLGPSAFGPVARTEMRAATVTSQSTDERAEAERVRVE